MPIGRNLDLRIFACDRGYTDMAALAKRFAEDLPKALVNVEAARWGLRRYARSVRRAVAAAIEESRQAGLELSLAGVTFKRTRAFHLTQSDSREAAAHILVDVLVEGLDHDLRPTVHTLIVEEPHDVAAAIYALHDDQRTHQDARDTLRRRGASVGVDEITLRHLARYGIDRLDALRAVVAAGHVNLPVTKRDGTAGTLFLRSDAGLVKSHIIDETDFVWLQDCLSLEGSSPPDNLDALIGRPIADICADDLFAGLTVSGVTRMGLQRQLLIEQPTHFVDLGIGRIWEERAAA